MRGNGPSRILGGPEIGTRRPEAGADGWANGGECVRNVHALEGLQPADPRGRGGVLEPQLSEPLVATRLPQRVLIVSDAVVVGVLAAQEAHTRRAAQRGGGEGALEARPLGHEESLPFTRRCAQ